MPDQYVTAIETALGHHLQLVLTEQPESAQPDSGRPQREQDGPRQRRAAGVRRQRPRQLAIAGDNRRRQPRRRARFASRAERRAAAGDGGGRERDVGPPAAGAPAGHDADRAGPGRGHGRLAREQRRVPFRHAERRAAEPPRHLHRRLSATGTATARRRLRSWAARTRSPSCSAALAELQEQVAEISRAQGRAAERADRAAGRPAAGADRTARPGSGHRHARRRVQRAAEFPAPAAPEDRHGRL